MIRRLTPEDAEELAALHVANREAASPHWPDLPDIFFTRDGQRARVVSADHLYGIVDVGSLAGTIELSNVVRGPFQSGSVGYWVDEARQGRGLATDALSALVELAFSTFGLHRLEAATLTGNGASQRVLEKNRFTFIGVAPRYLHIAGAWRDHVLYQRTIED